MARDPGIYPDPEQFIPERFLDKEGRLDFTQGDPTAFVYGFGRRYGRFFPRIIYDRACPFAEFVLDANSRKHLCSSSAHQSCICLTSALLLMHTATQLCCSTVRRRLRRSRAYHFSREDVATSYPFHNRHPAVYDYVIKPRRSEHMAELLAET